jgi:hypothetical protein
MPEHLKKRRPFTPVLVRKLIAELAKDTRRGLTSTSIPALKLRARDERGGYFPLGDDQVDQYMLPEEDIFPKAVSRPTSLTKYQDREFRSLGKHRPDTLYADQRNATRAWYLSQLEQYPRPSGISESVWRETQRARATKEDTLKKELTPLPFTDSELPKKVQRDQIRGEGFGRLGLGDFTTSIGKDGRGYYVSFFDAWDFEEEGSSGGVPTKVPRGVGEEILRRFGTPYNIYDRFYFTPVRGENEQLFVPTSFRAVP